MSEETKPQEDTAPDTVEQEDLELAVRVIMEWHKQKNLAFAIINSATGLMVSGGNALELEGALNHGHRMIEFDNGTRLMEIRNMHRAAQQARETK